MPVMISSAPPIPPPPGTVELKGQASQNSRGMTVNKIELVTMNDKKWNIEEMVMDFEYMESIESPFLRCDFTILDAVDFNLMLQGGEKINVNITTESALKDEKLEITMQVYKIGSIVKSERGQMYILHTVSPEMYNNEQFKVFQAFGPGKGAKDVENVPKYIVKEYLKGSKKIKKHGFENHSKYTFISPSWKPVDTIMFMSDKITRLQNSRGSDKQSGYLFWENSNGFNFRSIDSIADGGATRNIYTYNYVQKGTEPANKYYTIENIQYPDKANHLKSMRMGVYKSSAIGIALPTPKDASAPKSSKTEYEPAGTLNDARVMTYEKLFSKATTVETVPPFKTPEFLSESQPTRIKYRVLPGLKNQASKSMPNNGTRSDDDYMACAEYAAARYTLLKAIQLNIEVPGNVGLCAGSLIKLIIPGSRQKGANVKQDKKFSGKYVIAGLKHTYKRSGITTNLELVRDSLPRSGDA
tara:strand:+ start:10166 stop:11575 length:1410 start_codon:yes stop_codon:yes gene_type:complete